MVNSTKWTPGPSKIHGNGAMASRRINAKENIGPLITGLKGGGLLGGDRTRLGDLVNHQAEPNSQMKRVPGRTDHYYLKSLDKIDPGSEITMDYNDTPWFVAKPHQIDPKGYKSWG